MAEAGDEAAGFRPARSTGGSLVELPGGDADGMGLQPCFAAPEADRLVSRHLHAGALVHAVDQALEVAARLHAHEVIGQQVVQNPVGIGECGEERPGRERNVVEVADALLRPQGP